MENSQPPSLFIILFLVTVMRAGRTSARTAYAPSFFHLPYGIYHRKYKQNRDNRNYYPVYRAHLSADLSYSLFTVSVILFFISSLMRLLSRIFCAALRFMSISIEALLRYSAVFSGKYTQ